MTDIDTAVEIATFQAFEAFTHPYPSDYEPEPIIRCRTCGDVAVEHKGDECAVCSSDEYKAEAAEFAAWCAANPQEIEMVRLAHWSDAIGGTL